MIVSDLLSKDSFGFSVMELSRDPNITETDLVMDIFTMFTAGHETTAHTLSFFIYSLVTHPDVQKKCHDAIDAEKHSGECIVMNLILLTV